MRAVGDLFESPNYPCVCSGTRFVVERFGFDAPIDSLLTITQTMRCPSCNAERLVEFVGADDETNIRQMRGDSVRLEDVPPWVTDETDSMPLVAPEVVVNDATEYRTQEVSNDYRITLPSGEEINFRGSVGVAERLIGSGASLLPVGPVSYRQQREPVGSPVDVLVRDEQGRYSWGLPQVAVPSRPCPNCGCEAYRHSMQQRSMDVTTHSDTTRNDLYVTRHSWVCVDCGSTFPGAEWVSPAPAPTPAREFNPNEPYTVLTPNEARERVYGVSPIETMRQRLHTGYMERQQQRRANADVPDPPEHKERVVLIGGKLR